MVKASVQHPFFVDNEEYLSGNDTTRLELFEPVDVHHKVLTGEQQAGQAATTIHGAHQSRPAAIPAGTFVEDRTKLAVPALAGNEFQENS